MKTMPRVAVAALASTAQAGFPTIYPDEKSETLCTKVEHDPECVDVECPYDVYVECLATKMQVALCPEEIKLANAEDAKAMKAFVDGIAGKNTKIVTDSIANRKEIVAKLVEKAKDPNFIMSLKIVVGPLLMLVFSIIWFSFCCWSWCCCCRCCRCCSRERGPPRKRSRFLAVLMYVAGVVWFVVAASLLGKGLSSTRAGGNDLQCGAASVVKIALSGTSQKSTNEFIGMLPVLQQVSNLTKELDEGSNFLNEVIDIIDGTAPLERSVKSLTGLMQTVGQILAADETKQKEGNYHKCSTCKELGDSLLEVRKTIENGVSTSLLKARTQAKSQLQGERIEGLRTTARSSLDKFTGYKNLIVSKVGIVLDGKVKDSWGHAETGLDASLGVLLGLMLPVVLFGLFAMFLCLFKTENESAKAEGRNPYSPWAGRCAACGWCCGFCISFIAFLLASIFGLLGFSLTLGCSVLMDFDNGADLNDFLATLNQKENPQIADTFDICMTEKGNGNLVNVIKSRVCKAVRNQDCIDDLTQDKLAVKDDTPVDVTECALVRPKDCGDDEAEYLNLRESMSETIKTPLDDAFSKIEKSGAQTKLADNTKVTEFIDMLALPIGSFYLVDPAIVLPVDERAMVLEKKDPSNEMGGLLQLMITPLECETVTIPSSMKDVITKLEEFKIENGKIPGIKEGINLINKWDWGKVNAVDAADRTDAWTATSCDAGQIKPCPAAPSFSAANNITWLRACRGVVGEGHEEGHFNTADTLLKKAQRTPVDEDDLTNSINALTPLCSPCEAASKFLKRKLDEMNDPEEVYRCDQQQEGTEGATQDCDQVDDKICYVTASGQEGVEESKQVVKSKVAKKMCTFNNFTNDYKRFEKSFPNAVKAMDDQVVKSRDDIQERLRKLVNENLLKPLFAALDSLDCKPLGTAFWYLLNGLCYNMTPGFIYTAQALSLFGGNALFLMIVLYFVWRFVRDNINGWEKASRDA